MTTVDEVLTVKETAKVLRTNTSFVYQLIKKGFLPALKLGQLKVRRSTLMNFIESCEGKDFSDLDHVKDLEFEKITEEEKCC
ncbi:helix-turn-helix domain-containing protein [Coprococcus sp. CLA-AA-H190]|uniref:Helix-turn-helix domain-containing protein n=1 Tax=Coprococcus intestinihominis TaxID=3133154 RepID=A0ABV1B1U5_9FIRM|nr:helix-turn-helix domain-containing protein [Coprococcus catus]MCB6493116.1 helix-turn-helix domain-containing protein [Coprococcus catus]